MQLTWLGGSDLEKRRQVAKCALKCKYYLFKHHSSNHACGYAECQLLKWCITYTGCYVAIYFKKKAVSQYLHDRSVTEEKLLQLKVHFMWSIVPQR